MKALLLTDAENKQQILIFFGTGGAMFAKMESDKNGSYTELYDAGQELIVSVLETPAEIYAKLK